MKYIYIQSLQNRIETMLPTLNEYQRRRFLSAEAQGIGYGGISLVSRLSGVSRQTLTEGVKELADPDCEIMRRKRRGIKPDFRIKKHLLSRRPMRTGTSNSST
jgi:hypothetical protein